ncbi:MAG: ABC transporter substrate-binding protein [Ruminococcaceae bacterium]|nr:ABC transporter substrate-binding protein [Oscillospiraceae bacterium]
MKKLISLLLVLTFVFTCFVGCTKSGDVINDNTNTNEENNETPKVAELTRVMSLKGPTGMGMAKLMTDGDEKYSFSLTSMPDDVTSAIISKTVDIAAVPTNLASVLYNKTEGEVKVIALNTLGVLYVLNTDNSINSIEDLKGKTIGATGQASTPEYILRYVLSENGIDPDKDVTINYYTDHAELATHMINGTVSIGMLPEPQVSTVLMKNKDAQKVINLTEEWDKISPDSALVQGCLVVRTEFAEKYPDSVETFLEEYKASVEYANTSENAADTISAIGIVPSAAIAKLAIPGCNITFIDSETGMKEKLSGFLNVLYTANPKSVGGALPLDDFYYENK